MRHENPSPGQPAQWGCRTDGLLLIHAVFRNALNHAPAMVARTDPHNIARAVLVKDHLEEMLTVLHNHHIHEDTLYWDLLAQRAPHARADIARLKAQHDAIEGDIAPIRALLAAWAASPGDQDALQQALKTLQTTVTDHLDEEERIIMPLAAKVLTQAEWDRPALLGRKETPRNRLMVSLGYMLRCAPTQAMAQDFWSQVPPPVRLLYRLFGKKKFEQEWQALYGQGEA